MNDGEIEAGLVQTPNYRYADQLVEIDAVIERAPESARRTPVQEFPSRG